MPDLSRFAVFANKGRPVPHVPQVAQSWGTEREAPEREHIQRVIEPVPHVPLVPLENDNGWNEEDWRAAFNERAGILEYDGGLPRSEAERQARVEIAEMRQTHGIA
jgi:hypothetical protein